MPRAHLSQLVQIGFDPFRGEERWAFILIGGFTARATLKALEVSAIKLFDDLKPGVPFGTALDGSLQGHLIAFKPGGFGDPKTLRRLVARFCR